MDIGKSFAGEILKELKQQTYAFCDFKDAQLTSLDLSGKHFIACNFGNTRFVSVQLNKTKFDACFSSVYAKTHAVDTHFEKATILNTHFVIDKGESREYITMWDDEMEELIYDAQNIEGIDYTISRKIEALLKKEFENSLFLRLHLCAALFAEDGFHRSWMLVRLVNPKFCDSPGYGELFRLFIVSFLGDAYVGVREECLEHLKELQPTKKMLG
ncbi:MAG TPA: hypothetical protein VK622_00650, partial [Puia sp.]|nr:hypothetical protein [Puia sp.]